MTYGVRTWSANGVLEMDTDSYTYQVLHNAVYTLAMGAVVTATLPGSIRQHAQPSYFLPRPQLTTTATALCRLCL